MNEVQPLGYLRTCMDKRFLEATRQAFQKVTGLGNADYWQEAHPGGSAVALDSLGEEYAYAHGARIFGWQAHGDKCGGQPGVNDAEIETRLDAAISQKVQKFADARHFRIFATEGNIDIVEISASQPPGSKLG